MTGETTNLDGLTAVVTGAGRGLGRSYAVALAAAGASVVINDVDGASAEDAVADIGRAGGSAFAVVGPVDQTGFGEELVARTVERYGRLDTMVTNAGIVRDKVLWKMSDEEFDTVVSTHLRGTFLCARAAVQRMREQGDGGSLIVVGSPAGQRGNFGQGNYSAAKAGIAGLARTWSLECARDKITVNAIIPTAFTAMAAQIPVYAELTARVLAGEPVPRTIRAAHAMGTVDDVAPLVVFLASTAARGVTGQCIGIGGDKLSLWSHPVEIAAAYRDGGWSAADIAELWPGTVGSSVQSVGVVLPDTGGAN